MAAPYAIEGSNLTASLANNTSGTTFAAKARAAELNAVRSRKAAKDMESENKIPSVAPVALGALKFTKPRNRGRGWKALNLEELSEESTQGDDAFSENVHGPDLHNPQTIQSINNQNFGSGEALVQDKTDQQLLYHSRSNPTLSYQEPMRSLDPQKVDKMAKDIPLSNDNAKISLDLSRSSSVLTPNLNPNQQVEAGAKNNPTAPPDENSKPHGPKKNQQLLTLNGSEEERLRNLGVLPALKQSNVPHSKQKDDDDPFIERSSDLQRNLFRPYAQDQVDNFTSLGHNLPLAGMETKYDFRLPSTFAGGQQNKIKSTHDQAIVTNAGARGTPYQRDPMPYSSFCMSSKKDILLQNLHDVVESSKAQGNLPISTRTVLYDPVTRDFPRSQNPSSQDVFNENATHFYDAAEKFSLPAGGDKELLKGSDALPWTDRPVNIQDTASSIAFRSGLPTLPRISTANMPPPGLGYGNPGIWSTRPQPQSALRSLEEDELWFVRNSEGSQPGQYSATKANETLGAIGDRSTQFEKSPTAFQPMDSTTDGETAKALFQPVFENLVGYLESSSKSEYFGRYGRVPEWCIDKAHDANQSFFGDWGVPPSRVGRDPRYRSTFHDGRYTIYEETAFGAGRDRSGRMFH